MRENGRELEEERAKISAKKIDMLEF